MNQLTKPSSLLWGTLFLGLAANLLFFNLYLGVSAVLFAVLLIVALWAVFRQTNGRFASHTYWLFVPLLFSASMLMIRDNTVLTLLNFAVCAYSLMLIATFARGGDDVTRSGVVDYLTIPFRVLVNVAEQPYLFMRDQVDFQEIHQRNQHILYPVMRGVVIATPIMGVLLALLASADLIFATYLQQVWAIDWHIDLVRGMANFVAVLCVAWCAAGWLLYSVRRETAVSTITPHRFLRQAADRYPLGFLETATILILINIVFAAFVVIQFVYLMDGADQLFSTSSGYAEYARRGFFELVMVSILGLGLILSFHWFTQRDEPLHAAIFNGLCTLKVGLVLVMLISAYMRLSLYEMYFGFTEWRIYGRVTMIWLGILLLWFAFALWFQPRRLAVGGLMVGFGFVVTLNLLNPDAFVVRQNMIRYHQVGYVDVDYLASLSADAVPELVIAYQELHAVEELIHTHDCSWHLSIQQDRLNRVPCVETRHPTYFGEQLHARYTDLTHTSEYWHWPAFHYGRWQAYQALSPS